MAEEGLRDDVLFDRHRQLGADLEDVIWNMQIPAVYGDQDPHDEVVAVRTAVGLFDISALNIIHVEGPDAAEALNWMVSIKVPELKENRARLGMELTEQGGIRDDIMILRDGPEKFRISHGGGDTPKVLEQAVQGKNVKTWKDTDVHILSVQGPNALPFLNPNCDDDLARLKYFEHTFTKLFGMDVTIARCGYSGEYGFEVHVSSQNAVNLWDTLLDKGKAHGILPCSWTTIDLMRVEGALLFYPFDMPWENTTPWEIDWDWAVDEDKEEDWLGKEACLASKGKERSKIVGLSIDHPEDVEEEAKVLKDGQETGVVTMPGFSRYLMRNIALAHVKPEHTAIGTQLEVKDGKGTYKAHVMQTPFYDPMRMRSVPEQFK
ncbi:aminomethyltransferase family protein [Thiohalorhabdus methylotrophus]|uniref:Aminomethyltransferase family protein n=1 Tax=Thiohalorhabdus methylotrophus TaxID=3242694 RepID=A0ABV4TYR1_9GAMM